MADFEAVIVDNASTDGSADNLTLPDDRFRLICAGANLGFAAGNNLGARGCTAPWIATLNPDARPRPDWLDQLCRASERHAGVGVFGSTQLLGDDGRLIDGFGDVMSIYGLPWRGGHGQPVELLPAADTEIFAPCAAAALYRRDLFEAEGGFDEAYFCYLEDVDLGFRLRLAGERCVQVRHAIVHHDASAITGRQSRFTLFHSYRNRLWLLAKTMPLPLLPLVVPLHVAAVLYLLIRVWPVPGAVPGLLAGFAGLGGALRRRRQVRRRLGMCAVAALLVWRPGAVRARAIHGIGAP